jgi:hypothetical protein
MIDRHPRLLLLVATLLVGVGTLWLAGYGSTAVRITPDEPPPPAGLAPRTAALLAFHEAQDAADVPRMLLAAERLERLGEPALGAHVRHVARAVADDAVRSAADAAASGRLRLSGDGRPAPGSP